MWVVFELIIYFFLIVVGAFLMEVATKWKTFSNRRLIGAAALVLGIGWVTIFYGSFIEPRLLVVRQTEIALSAHPTETITVAVVSDLHLGPYKQADWAERVVETVMREHPDLILLAGDYIALDPSEAAMLAPLKALDAPLGVFAVTGNHDYEDGGSRVIIDALEQADVVVLENERTTIRVGDRTLTLVGVSDVWNDGNAYRAMAGVAPEDTVVLLVHNPDVVLSPNADLADLVVAGHTHGGQIRLPFLGPVPEIPDALGRAYDRGLFGYGAQQLFITSGVGETGPRARLFNPPVVDLLQLAL